MRRNMIRPETSDMPTTVRCSCGCSLTVLPAGVRVVRQGGEATQLTCSACGEVTRVRMQRG